MNDEIHTHYCDTPGLTMGRAVITAHHNHDGPVYYKATAQIGSVFGSAVHGEIEGIGPTHEKALERLDEERRRLHESLWA